MPANGPNSDAVAEHLNSDRDLPSVSADNEGSALDELLAGFHPEQVPELSSAAELEQIYPLVHALTRGSITAFMVRVAALEALAADRRSPLTPSSIAEILYWLTDVAREHILRTFRSSGWLTYQPAVGYRISTTGQFVATVLSFLRARLREGDLLPTVEGIDYMLRLGVDPVRQLLLLRSRLEGLRNEMETARNSHSEVILRAASGRLQDALALSERIRAVLTRVPLEMSEARHIAQDVHELLSRLHGVGSDLHAAITEVGRQYLHLVSGLTTADIIATLMRVPASELDAASKSAMRPIVPKTPFLIPELLGAEAEAYLSRPLHVREQISWREPPPPESVAPELILPQDVVSLLDNLDSLAESQGEQSLTNFLPRGSATETFLRASLLALLQQHTGGEGVAGRLSQMPVQLQIEGDGLPIPAPPPISGLSPGTISACEKGNPDE